MSKEYKVHQSLTSTLGDVLNDKLSKYIYESMVSLVSRRYMRGENGTESLVVCLCVYIIYLYVVYTVCLAYSNRKTKCQN